MRTWIYNTSKCGEEAGERIRIKTHTGPLGSTTSPILMVLGQGMNGKLDRMTWIQGSSLGVKPRDPSLSKSGV